VVTDNEVSVMIDGGDVISIVASNLGKHDLATMKDAHGKQESGKVVGKLIMEAE